MTETVRAYFAKLIPSPARRIRGIPFAAIGTSAYVLGFAIQSTSGYPFIALIVFAALSLAFEHQDAPPARPAGLVFVLLFVVSFGVSAVASIDMQRSLLLSASLLPAGLVYFLIVGQFRSLFHVRMVLFSFCAVSIVVSGSLIFQAMARPDGSPTNWIFDLANPMLVVPNDIALLAVISPISIALFCRERNVLIKAMALSAVALSVIAIGIYQSRSGILTMLVSTGFCVWMLRPRLTMIVAVSILLLGLFADALFGFPMLAKFEIPGERRFALWLAAWEMFLEAPFIGHGPRTYGLLVNSYVYDLQVPDSGFLRELVVPWFSNIHSPWAHNLYLEVLAAQGVIGLFALLGVLGSALNLGWKLRNSANEIIQFYGIAMTSGLLGFCLASLYELSFLRIWVVIVMFSFMAVLACLNRFYSEDIREQS